MLGIAPSLIFVEFSALSVGLPSGSTPRARRRKIPVANLGEHGMASPYDIGLDKNAANYVPLSPIGFLLRSAEVYPQRTSVIYGARRYTWAQTLERCRRLASALAKAGIGRGDTVAVMAPNLPEGFEATYGV